MRRSNYTRRTSILGTLIAAVCILVYLGALVSVIVGISTSTERRRDVAYDEFERFQIRVAEAGFEVGCIDDDEFFRRVQAAVDESATIEGVIIFVQGGIHSHFQRSNGNAITLVDGLPRFRERFGFSWNNMSAPMQIWAAQRNISVNIQAVAARFDADAIAGILKNAMIAIAISLAVAFFTLLVESSVQRRRGLAYAGDAARPKTGEAPREQPRGDAHRPAVAAEPAREARSEPRREPRVELRVDAEKEAKKEKPQPSAHKPGSYSERGHVVRKEHTESRLAEEIARSAATGQDLAFIVVEFKPTEADNYYARLAADAARFFSSREFVCERGERGLSIVCPGLSLDMGFLNATEFHNRILGKYPAVFKQKTDLCMGISACSEREVNAARLVFEAEEALERAMLDPASHIIAFKSDPDKYRAFMEGRRSGSGS